MDLFEPIGEALVVNGVTNSNSEIHLSGTVIIISVIVISFVFLSICYK